MASRSSPTGSRTRRATVVRLLATCWLIYSLHFATNMVRENYLALSIGDGLSFRVDEYAGLHDDLFDKPGYGWHIASNPGASMIAALPYAMSRAAIDPIVRHVRERRAGVSLPPRYDAPIAKDREFFAEAWRRGLDLKFGLASFVMQSGCMAISSALGVWAMFALLRRRMGSERRALLGALLFAFGTPVFFRTGFLNHNLMLGHVAFAGFAVLWSFGGVPRPPIASRFALAGLAGGVCTLLDYSGLIALVALALYGASLPREGVHPSRLVATYALGALGPLALLAFYQWQSFGHPLYPAQHWMPWGEYIESGYQGVDWPQLDLLWSLAFDVRYGLFVSCPLFLLSALATSPRWRAEWLPRREAWMALGMSVALLVFFSGVHYARWQFNTGVRYLAPTFPFLFLASWSVVVGLSRWLRYAIALPSLALAWSMAMHRDVSGGKVDLADPDVGLGVIDSLWSVLTEGLQLPAWTTLTRMEAYAPLVGGAEASPWPLFALTGAALVLLWWPWIRSAPRASPPEGPSRGRAEGEKMELRRSD